MLPSTVRRIPQAHINNLYLEKSTHRRPLYSHNVLPEHGGRLVATKTNMAEQFEEQLNEGTSTVTETSSENEVVNFFLHSFYCSPRDTPSQIYRLHSDVYNPQRV